MRKFLWLGVAVIVALVAPPGPSQAEPVNQVLIRGTVLSNAIGAFGVCKISVCAGEYSTCDPENGPGYPFDLAINPAVAGGDCSELEEDDCVTVSGEVHSGLTLGAGYVHLFAYGWIEEDPAHCDIN